MRNNEIGYLIKKISLLQKAEMDASLQEFDLTSSQFRVLFILQRHDGEMTQKELERELGVSHPTVNGLVNRLEKQGFLETRTDPADRRHRLVKLTEKADSVKEDMLEQRRKAEERLTKGLSREELLQLRSSLEKIHHNMQLWKEGEIC